MDWTQTLTIIVTLGSVLIFFIKSTKDEINKIDLAHREDMKSHREDMQKMDEKWMKLFDKFLELQNSLAKRG